MATIYKYLRDMVTKMQCGILDGVLGIKRALGKN